MFVEYTEKKEFPGFGFSAGVACKIQGRRTAPEGEKLYLGGSEMDDWVYTVRRREHKMEIPE